MTLAQHVSVALCTYNGEKYLAQQLDSLAHQTRLPDELVVCDDRSSDATPDMVEEFARTAPFPVRLFRNPVNLRSTRNFEQAIALCDGEFISLCDQDDIWLPEKIASELSVLEQDATAGGVFSDAELIDASSRRIGKRLWANVLFTPREQSRFQSGHGAEVLLKGNVVTGATLMFRSSLRPIFMPIPAGWVHDGWIAWMLLTYSKLAFVSQPLMQYRLHAGQQIGVEALTLAALPLRQRLQKGKQGEPAKHLAVAAELEALRQSLLTSDLPGNRNTAMHLQQKIAFLQDRAAPYNSRGARALQLLMRIRDYRRYESSWKAFLRDIVMVFV